jgi:hypothetical protein
LEETLETLSFQRLAQFPPSGGLAEPIHPEELTKSTIEVKEGAAELSLPQ